MVAMVHWPSNDFCEGWRWLTHQMMDQPGNGLRARAKIPFCFCIPSSGQVGPIFTRTIINVFLAMPAIVLPQIDQT